MGVRAIMHEVDAIDRLRTREALTAAVEGHRRRLTRSVRDNAVWTKAADSVAGPIDRVFAWEWWGAYTTADNGRDATIVLDENRRPFLAYAGGRELGPDETARVVALSMPVVRMLPPTGDHARGGLVASPAGVALVAAANIIPYPADRTPARMARPVHSLVFIAELNPQLLRSLNEGVKVAGLHLERGGSRTALTIDALDGEFVRLAWTPRDLGEGAIRRALGYIAPGLAVAIALIAVAVRSSLRSTAALERLAHSDSLTGLANRPAFLAELERRARRGGVAVGLGDLNGFKAVNDTHGHLAGDDLLKSVATELRAAAGPHFAARLGGDEFAFLAPTLAEAERVAAEFTERLGRPLAAGCVMARVGVAIGIAEGAPGSAPRDIIALADARLYRDKDGSRANGPQGAVRLRAKLVG